MSVPDSAGPEDATHTWHVLDNAVVDPLGTLLCVHGNPTWSYLWRGLLADPPAGWRVIAPDHLGMGWSERTGQPRTVAQRVTDLGDLTTALRVSGPVVTVGHDWGGSISLGWALAHRDQLTGVVLTNTAVALADKDHGPALIRLAHVPLLRAWSCVRTETFVRGAGLLSRPALSADVRRALASPYRTARRRQAVAEFVADIPFTTDHPSSATVAGIAEGIRAVNVPALFLWGPRDPVFGERYLADLRDRLPQAQLHRYEGASHLVTEDAPQYASAVGRWVTDLNPPNASPEPTPERSSEAGSRGLFAALAQRSADDTAAIIEVDGATVSWRQLVADVHDLAAGLSADGMRPGDRVAVLVPPSADLTLAVYAVWRAGGVVVVADKGLGLRGMRRALRSASVQHVVGSAQGLLAARAMGLPGSRVLVGDLPRVGVASLSARSVGQLMQVGRTSPRARLPAADADCAVVFTSGATGPAKGVVYRHHQLAAQLELLRSTYAIGPQDRLVAAFAPFALLGPALGVATVVPNIDVTAPHTLTAALLAEAVQAAAGTVVFAAPAALRRVASTSSRLSADQRDVLASVRLLVSAGAPVPAPLLRRVLAILPNASAHTPYGMTEALPVSDISLAEIEQAGPGNGVCVGLPLAGVTLAISPLSREGRADGALTTNAWATGEICVQALHVKDRYDSLWATQRDTGRNPGWHRTGDVGHLDDAGRLWVEGRLVHVVTTADGPVTTVGIEQRIESLDAVASAAVVGVGPPGAQVIVVVIVPTARQRATRRLAAFALTDHVRDVAGAEVAAVLCRTHLPVDIRHASKIDRLAVARWAERVLAGSRLVR
ncbi:MAG TPA: alpha/beta fold hydrolase [Lapillicoccus sp.]|uniref:alpha/beta fold hydrolase n=1 Tax=Lapillicoccus sp. TaxID=1909287 RepID=UPI002F923E3B